MGRIVFTTALLNVFFAAASGSSAEAPATCPACRMVVQQDRLSGFQRRWSRGLVEGRTSKCREGRAGVRYCTVGPRARCASRRRHDQCRAAAGRIRPVGRPRRMFQTVPAGLPH